MFGYQISYHIDHATLKSKIPPTHPGLDIKGGGVKGKGNKQLGQDQCFGSGSALNPGGVKSAKTERKNGAKRQKIYQ
jgi:hypothetical protein